MEAFVIILIVIVVWLILRIEAGGMDRERVAEYVARQGGKLLSSNWELFGPGWLGDKNRIYSIRYLDAAGNEHSAMCKTSAGAGVYFTADEIVQRNETKNPGEDTLVPAIAEIRTASSFRIYGLDHVQLAMPPGHEETARRFYTCMLGLTEVPKPASLAGRGGVWFEGGTLRLHLGVEPEFRPARKAHPALLVQNLDAFIAHMRRSGIEVLTDEPLEGFRRVVT